MHVKKACIPKPVTAISDDAVQGLQGWRCRASTASLAIQLWLLGTEQISRGSGF